MPPRTTTAVPTHEVVVRPVWAGPCDSGPNGGVTVSLLQKFLSCRHRFRCYAIEGWKAAPRFCHRLFYGSLWHAAEEGYAATADVYDAMDRAEGYAEQEASKFPTSRDDIAKWYNVCRVTFPEYVAFWSRPQTTPTAPHTQLLQEQVFDVPYRLPSGRVVRLRGRWDGVTRAADTGAVWNFETKTKGDVDPVEIPRQLTFDLQTMTYLVALNGAKFHRLYDLTPDAEVVGVRYNVVRRPLSGGKGTIVRHKPSKSNPAGESESDYYNRLREYVRQEPETYFYRWTVDVSDADVGVFRSQFLDPCLEFLCLWYETVDPSRFHPTREIRPECLTWRTPNGLTSQIVDGYGSDLDRYINEGSTLGLQRVDTLFPELKE